MAFSNVSLIAKIVRGPIETEGVIMYQEGILRDALSLSINAIAYFVSETLASRFPDKALIAGHNSWFDVKQYAEAGHCLLVCKEAIYNQSETHWSGRELTPRSLLARARETTPAGDVSESFTNAWLEIQWRDSALDVLVLSWFEQYRWHSHFWILANSKEQARAFLKEVCAWNAAVRGEVLVFNGGCWHKDATLFQSIKNASFDNLILRGNLKQEILEDLKQFFASRETYEIHDIPWKRGLLFIGPPGNGKTHAVKALINALEQPCLYIKSFHHKYITDEENIHTVFDQARKSAPCILVLEDLDSLLNDTNRSFFLNELDGFAANIGVILIATTNHPERLDPAILDRPSRFDRKYPFDLPASPERLDYIALWNRSLRPALRLSEDGVTKLVSTTEGFSFAYLKELFLSSMMCWISNPEQGHMEQVLLGQEKILRHQMVSTMKQDSKAKDDDMRQNSDLATLRRIILKGDHVKG
jgi:AAA+ superfamily predicted ATPase